MLAHRIKFLANMSIVIAMTHLVTWYIFTPIKNDCQMTFMMEPPKFLEVPIRSEPRRGSHAHKTDDAYKLYMYSEFGFPQSSDVQRDLRDSMPVLFVPGNAGSYQQVRSIASTCIRHQLQSLDAFKFIFYTIDFRGQLSGVSGRLIEDQTQFVFESLLTITRMHPTDTKGIILIGHSVGGFISKYLFTIPGFDIKSVPLLISLASPLTKPYLSFDAKMSSLYQRTEKFWSDNQDILNNTLSISISGGKLDRLVPTYLSIDEQFDLSLTTNSIKDVWLATDHVCITWCRELMNKLANLLSALMDKRETCLIDDKRTALSIITRELMSIRKRSGRPDDISTRAWKSKQSHTILDYQESHIADRSLLSNQILILNTTKSSCKDILIYLEHLGNLKEDSIFGCESLIFDSDMKQLKCQERVDLLTLLQVLPSRRFEPKRAVIESTVDITKPKNFIIFDFSSSGRSSMNINKTPERIIISDIEQSNEQALHIPSLFEYIWKSILFVTNFRYDMTLKKRQPISRIKYTLSNLMDNTQSFKLIYLARNCLNEKPNTGVILLYQNNFLLESFYTTNSESNRMSAEIELKKPLMFEGTSPKNQNTKIILEFLVDGTCDSSIKIRLNHMDLIVILLQTKLNQIITGATLITYINVVTSAFQHVNSNKFSWTGHQGVIYAAGLMMSSLDTYNQTFHDSSLSDATIVILLTMMLSYGAVAFLDYFLRRMADISLIMNDMQARLRNLVSCRERGIGDAPSGLSSHGSEDLIKSDLDWLIIAVAFSLSILLSAALMSIVAIFMTLKSCLTADLERRALEKVRSDQESQQNSHCRETKDNQISLEAQRVSSTKDLLISLAVFLVIAIIPNIPLALMKMNIKAIESLKSVEIGHNFWKTALVIIMTKLSCDQTVVRLAASSSNGSVEHGKQVIKQADQSMTSYLLRYSHALTMLPIMMIGSNLSKLLDASCVLLIWLSIFMLLKRGHANHIQADR